MRFATRWPIAVLVFAVALVLALILMDVAGTDPCTDYGPHEFKNEVDKCGNPTNNL